MTNIQIKPVTGVTIMEELKNAKKEATIEFFYKHQLKDMFHGKFAVNDDTFVGTRAMTDGRLTYIIDQNHMIVGIQEAKFRKASTLTERKKALCQALHYNYFKYTQEFIEYDYFFLPTEKGVAYVLRKDIEQLIKLLDPLFAKTDKSPSTNWADLEIRTLMQRQDIDFHYVDITPDFELNKFFAEIFNKVIKSWE